MKAPSRTLARACTPAPPLSARGPSPRTPATTQPLPRTLRRRSRPPQNVPPAGSQPQADSRNRAPRGTGLRPTPDETSEPLSLPLRFWRARSLRGRAGLRERDRRPRIGTSIRSLPACSGPEMRAGHIYNRPQPPCPIPFTVCSLVRRSNSVWDSKEGVLLEPRRTG